MFKSLSIIAFVAFLACSSRAGQIVLGSDQTESSPFNSGYDKFIEDLLKEWHVPGIAIAVIHENQTWAKVRFLLQCVLPSVLPKFDKIWHGLFRNVDVSPSMCKGPLEMLPDAWRYRSNDKMIYCQSGQGGYS